jgi:hypothetical protein
MPNIVGNQISFRVDGVGPAGLGVRIAKYSALIRGGAGGNVSTFLNEFVALPTGPNQGPVMGVTAEHFFEPMFFFRQGTDPSLVTTGGSNANAGPTLYNMQTRPVLCQVDGYGYVYAAGAVNQGDILVIADQFGRVNNLANLGIGAGTLINPVGVAQTQTANPNDLVYVRFDFTPFKI